MKHEPQRYTRSHREKMWYEHITDKTKRIKQVLARRPNGKESANALIHQFNLTNNMSHLGRGLTDLDKVCLHFFSWARRWLINRFTLQEFHNQNNFNKSRWQNLKSKQCHGKELTARLHVHARKKDFNPQTQSLSAYFSLELRGEG